MCITRATVLTFPIPSFCFIWLMQRISSGFVCSVSQTRLLLNVDLPTFPRFFFQKCCLGAGWELFLGVYFHVFCAVLKAALSLEELDIEHRNVLLFSLPERTVFPRTRWPWEMPRTVKQNIFVQDLDFLCWVCFSSWHSGWWQKVPRNTWIKQLRWYSSPLLGLCAVDIEELTPICYICTTASLPWTYSRTLREHYTVEKIRHVSRWLNCTKMDDRCKYNVNTLHHHHCVQRM